MKHKISKLLFTAGGVILLATLAGMGLALAQGGGQLTRLTVAPDNQSSIGASLNADGTKVAFGSSSNFLGPSFPTSFLREVWLYDTATMTYTQITSVAVYGGFSEAPSLSGDGKRVAFQSNVDLQSGGTITNNYFDIWLYDLETPGTYTRVTTSTPVGRDSRYSSLSADGNRVAFETNSTFLGADIGEYQTEIGLYDVATGEYTRVTTANPSGRDSHSPSLNSDGSKLVFSSDSDLLGQSNVDYDEIWLYDTGTMTYTRITTTPVISGARANEKPSLSGDGRRIVFQSDADFLNEGIQNNQYEIWLYDTETITYTRISTTTGGINRRSYGPRISADGRRVAFYSDSDYWDPGNIADDQYEIWLYDIESKQYTRVTIGTIGVNVGSINPSLSLAGTRVAFESNVDLTSEPVVSLGHKEIWMYEGVERMYFPMVKREGE